MTRRTAKILLVDDHPILRRGVRTLLEAIHGVEVVGEASSGADAIERTRSLRPDIVVMDVTMPGMDGLEATRRIVDLEPGVRVLVLTVHEEDEVVAAAVKAGASGLVRKTVADDMLEGAIAALMRGYSYLPRKVTSRHSKRFEAARQRGNDGAELLTNQERRVIALTAAGHTAQEVATTMQLSSKTVEGYLGRAKSKLGLKSRSDIVRFALESGLLGLPESS